MAAGDGTPETGHHVCASAGESRRPVSAHGAGWIRFLSGVAARERPVALVSAEPHRDPAAARRARQPRHLRRQPGRPARGHDPHHRCRTRSADRVRERREPSALARDGTAQGDLGSSVARRNARAPRPSAADREPAALGARRRVRHSRRLLGQAAAARRSGSRNRDRLARRRVRRGDDDGDSDRVRSCACDSREQRERQRRAEGHEPQPRRRTQRAEQGAARRAGRDFARAPDRCGTLSADGREPAARRRRIRSEQSRAVPCEPAIEPIRRQTNQGVVRRDARSPEDGERRPRLRVVGPCTSVRQRERYEHVRSGRDVSGRRNARHQSRGGVSELLRDVEDPARRGPRLHGERRRRQPVRRDRQRSSREEVLPEPRSDRTALRQLRRRQRQARK